MNKTIARRDARRDTAIPRETRSNLAVFISFIFIIFGLLATVLVIFKPIQEPRHLRYENPPNLAVAGNASRTQEAAIPERPSETIDTSVSYPSVTQIDIPEASPPPERPIRTKRLVIVIDDVGHNIFQLEEFLKVPFPITFAVLPDLSYSTEAAQKIVAAGKELILHQPMEALGTLDPGPQAIYSTMKKSEIEEIIEANIKKYPGIKGMNNHMGSLATQFPEVDRTVLQVAEKNGIYFLDSLTIQDSAVHTVAKQEGIKSWERDVFLDNIPDKEHFLKYINEGLHVSEKKGHAVMIGHVWSTQLAQVLMELYPHLVEEGYSLTTISKIMLEEADANTGN